MALVAAVTLLAIDLAIVAGGGTDPAARVAAELDRATTTSSTTVATTAPPTTAATTTTAPPTTTTTVPPPPPAATAPAPAAAGSWSLDPYRGLGAWVDVYDWTTEFGGEMPAVGPDQIDHMARVDGVQTLFIQTSHFKSAADVIEPDRLRALIERAHANRLPVVAWYLPTLEDLELDLHRLLAGAAMGVDGLAVDIESRKVEEPAERNRRLLELSARLRAAVGGRAIGAITPSAVHLQVVNPGWWPEFPWAEIAQTYDAILPMAYWSVRGGEYRNAERYIAENIDRIRASTGEAQVAVHPIGGIADAATVEDMHGFVRAAAPRGVLGGSLYDFNTSNAEQWQALAPFRDTANR